MMELLQSVPRRSLLVVVVVVMVSCLLGSGLGDLQASPDSQYCTQHPTFLFCDFLGAQELVVLETLPGRGGQRVSTMYMHNAEQMLVASDICVSLVAFSVGNITYSGIPQTCDPNQHFSSRLVDSNTNLVPPYISQLDMQRSTAKEVIIDRNVRSFSVSSSDIGHLKVSKPIRALNIKVENSHIDNLENLHLESKSHLVLYNVTINRMIKSSIYLKESSVNIWKGNIKTSLNPAIILGPRASLSMTDTDGKLSFAGPLEVPSMPASPPQQEHRPPGVLQPPAPLPERGTRACNQSVLVWVLPTVLAAVEAIIILINCANWFPSLKRRKLPQGLEEGGQRGARQMGPVGNNSSFSTWHYNTEVPLLAVNRRQNTEYKYK